MVTGGKNKVGRCGYAGSRKSKEKIGRCGYAGLRPEDEGQGERRAKGRGAEVIGSGKTIVRVDFSGFLHMDKSGLMTMLIGVLCEVITAVAKAEKEIIQVKWVKDTLCSLVGSKTDKNDDG